MTKEQQEQLALAWDIDQGFFGKLRQGVVDKVLFDQLITLLKELSYEEDAVIPRRVVSLLWYIPLFMEWQKERIGASFAIDEYNFMKTEIENELELILGVP